MALLIEEKKSKTFAIPDDFQDGPKGNLWPLLWSATHGPVYFLEPTQSHEALEHWRQVSLTSLDSTAIFLAVKSNQKVFNGYGAQETCDMLSSVLIHPCMPAYQVCGDEQTWTRFKQGVLDYQIGRLDLLATGSLPLVSGQRPFRMNHDAHDCFMSHVMCYQRRDLNDSVTSFYASTKIPKLPPTKVCCNRVRLPNYLLTIPCGKISTKTCNVYTPIIAQPGVDWWPINPLQTVAAMDHDVKNIYSSTTLGPYSFSVFIQCAWTVKKVGDTVPKGCRPLHAISHSQYKRPLASDIKANEPAKKKPKNILADGLENAEPADLNTRTMRSGRKLSR
ncbi:hypothetical protein GALMADRAFT_210772 [Galerina marginata CBS 339.88]|uniref:Uncharacterized protein n=1 Tax=Galerina marginata (strain CBS 339.88) TaxID=685588 RepID=A0A067SYX3_GALM3|nr:hypothetical protein GALMADRAFT_210772 [Galerina marginata CBS 339.88]